jgi:flagellar basal-body rod protein FlgG, Gram-negative bacteria
MIRALWTSASGMIAQQLNLDVTANNLANVNTTGFKKNRAEFEDLMYQNMKIAGSSNQDGDRLPVGMQVGMGVRPVSVHKIFSQGDFQNTGESARSGHRRRRFLPHRPQRGRGLYQKRRLQARQRRAHRDRQRASPAAGVHRAARDPEPRRDRGRPLTCVDKAGEEIAGTDIPVYTFVNPAGLKAVGRNLYVQTDGSGEAVESVPGENNAGTLAQGFLEMSNVEIVEEMVNMIVGQRAYEANSKSITTADMMLQTANQLKR